MAIHAHGQNHNRWVYVPPQVYIPHQVYRHDRIDSSNIVLNTATNFNPEINMNLNIKMNKKLFILAGWGRSFLSFAWSTGVQLVFTFVSGFSKLFGAQGSPSSGSLLSL